MNEKELDNVEQEVCNIEESEVSMETKKDSTEEKVNQYEQQLVECRTEVEAWKKKLVHVSADFENFKKRVNKEKSLWIQAGQKELITDLLAIVGDFDRAVQEHQKKERTPQLDAWLTGFEMINKSLYKFLKKYEVEEITELVSFDPTLHEALVHIESAQHESGQIIEVMQKGFTFKGEVLRPAKVSVAK